MASVSSSRSQRSSAISPFRSRKSPVPPLPVNRQAGRPSTPSPTASSRPPSKLSISPVISASATPSPSTLGLEGQDVSKAKENVTVTVRFRPLSVREINKGDEISWYSDGDHTVRNESNPSISYGFDRVFGPATTTRHVYDVAAHHVIDGAMQGINGTVFAYGVTSSGKTHTMHGEQKSPGIIPLAVKDVFAIIQETPGREFLLRVSYLEIYNEVINDLLNPTGQNLRVREDVQGTYVEGIKEEVVLSPAHALSLIASGEEHRHVGSNNFNLLSSRSHTIFTMSIESSPCGGHHGEEDVSFSQLHLIDLAGSESSKTETTGLRRKEGSYINKSLLTLGTVISKLTDEKATHVPFRDSKLTRLLQSSLSGHGRVSLICTVTPASSNSEETHNTLKFAHRSKRVEIKASQNKIMDEKSLIKKYQKEISSLKMELQQLKQGMMESPLVAAATQEDLVNLKIQLEADQMKLQTRLEEEEQAKAALMGRIQRLTKLILVSTKNTLPSNVAERPVPRRRHSFGEDELAYLPDKKRDYMNDDDSGSFASELSAEGRDDAANLDEFAWDSKRSKRRGMLGWFKLRKPENLLGLPSTPGSDSSGCDSPACGMKSSQNRLILNENRKSVSVGGDDSSFISSYQEQTQAGDLFCATIGNRLMPSTGTTITDQMDLLREQLKMLAGEIALSTSSLKRLSKQAARNPDDSQLKECMQKLKDEISEKKHQMHVLEKRMIKSVEMSPHIPNGGELSQALSKLTIQLNEKTFELEIKAADNRILQEQLQTKIAENVEMQDTILLQRQQLNSLSEKCSSYSQRTDDIDAFQLKTCSEKSFDLDKGERNQVGFSDIDIATPTSVMSFSRVILQEDSKERKEENVLHSRVLMQAAEIENLRQEKVRLIEERDGLEVQSSKLAEEASYAKELAAAAAVELQNLAKEVTKLSYSNAKLTSDLAAAHGVQGKLSSQRSILSDTKRGINNGPRSDRTSENGVCIGELQRELNVRYQREAAFEKTLSEREQTESELRRKLSEAKQHEEYLENELASMWGMVAKMRKSGFNTDDISAIGVQSVVEGKHLSFGKVKNGDEEHGNLVKIRKLEDLKVCYEKERMRCKELESLVSRLKGEEISDLNVAALEDLQNLHVEALTKICQAKDETLLRPCRTNKQSENQMMFGCSLIIVLSNGHEDSNHFAT